MWYTNIEFTHVSKCHSNLILTRSKFLPRLVSRIVMICINCLYFVAIDLHWFFRTRCTLNVEIMRANHFWHMRSNKASLLYISQIFLCACIARFPSPKKQQQNMSKIVFFSIVKWTCNKIYLINLHTIFWISNFEMSLSNGWTISRIELKLHYTTSTLNNIKTVCISWPI